MNIAPWLVAVTVAAGAPAAQPSISPATVNLAIVDATFVETLETIEKATGIEIRVDESVSDEVRNRKVPHVNFVNARVDDALQFLAKFSGLVVEIVNEKTAVIKPRQ